MNNCVETEKKSNRQILKGSIMAYVSLAVNIIAGIVYTPWMVRQIGQSNYGLYTLAISITSILMFDFGIGAAITRFAAKYRAANDEKKLSEFVGLVYKLYIAIDMVAFMAASVLFIFLGNVYVKLTVEELDVFRIVYIMVIGYNLIAFPFTTLNGILGAYEEFVVIKFCELLTRLVTIVLVIVSLFMGYGLYALVLSNIIGGLISIVIKWYYAHVKLKVKAKWKIFDKALLLEVFGFSVWTAISGVATTIGANLMPSLITALQGSVETAIYGAANTLNGYAYLLTSALTGMFLPKVTRVMAQEDAKVRLEELSIRVGRILMYMSAIIIVGFYCVGKDFFILWMGEEYIQAYYCSCFLLVGELLFNSFQIYNTAMTAEGYVKPVALIKLLSAVISLVLGGMLIPYIGAIGAGAAISISYVLRGIANLYSYKKYLGVRIKPFLRDVYLVDIIYIVLMVICMLIGNMFPADKWILLLLKAALVMMLFVIVTIIFVLNNEERAFINHIIKGKKG